MMISITMTMTWDGIVRPMTETSIRRKSRSCTYKRRRRSMTKRRGIGKLVACGKNELDPGSKPDTGGNPFHYLWF